MLGIVSILAPEALDETLAAGKYKYDKRVEQSFAKPELISARADNAEKGKEKARKRYTKFSVPPAKR